MLNFPGEKPRGRLQHPLLHLSQLAGLIFRPSEP